MPAHPKQPNPESVFLLAGMVHCGHCNSIMAGGTDQRNARREGTHMHGRPWRHYRCNNKQCEHRDRVAADLLEARVTSILTTQILTVGQRAIARSTTCRRSSAATKLAGRIGELNQQISQLEAALRA